MKYKKIILRISGGIGNQLFQCGYALAEARRSGDHVKLIVLSYYQNQFWSKGSKYSAQRKLRFQELLPGLRLTEISHSKMGLLLDLMLKLRVFRNSKFQMLYGYVTGTLVLDGYFQSPNDFKLTKHVLTEMRSQYLNAVHDKEHMDIEGHRCVIHVRAGDLLHQPWNQLCNTEYYRRAIGHMQTKYNICEYDVVTEDCEYASNLLKNIDGVNINILPPGDEVADFTRLAAYRYLICANSTFSWWAATLGKALNFCAPEYFYKPGDKPNNIETESIISYS